MSSSGMTPEDWRQRNERWPTIGVRVSRPVYDILKGMATERKMTVATLVRDIVADTLEDSTDLSKEEIAGLARSR